MIKVILQGGLGNQMFEYAAAYALSRRNNMPFALDMSYMDVFGHKSWCRPYELSVFALHQTSSVTHDYHLAVHLLPRIRQWCRRRGWHQLGRYVFEIKDIEQLPICRSMTIFDYCTNYKLFDKYRDDILLAFSFVEKPNIANAEILKEIQETNSVAVHIRRGDYLNSFNNNVFFHPSEAWYRNAMEEIRRRVDSPRFYFFSDDIQWVREHFADIEDAVYVDINHGKSAYNDMRLMSACKHNIIANSTFSWWAAWLNINPQKIVIAPQKYYRDESSNKKYVEYMIPPNWIKME